MIDERDVFEKSFRRYEPEDGSFDRLQRRRDRKRRNQRIAAGVVGIAVFVAAVWIVTSGPFDQPQTEGVPGGAGTGQTETGPPVTGPAETGRAVTGVENPESPSLAEPALIGTVTRSGAGCALELDAGPIPSGAGRLSIVNETDREVGFELYRLASEASFAQFEAVVAEGDALGLHPPGAFFLYVQRVVRPGASGTITDNFTTGDAFAVVCLDHMPHRYGLGHLSLAEWLRHGYGSFRYLPFAVVGPIVVP